MSTTKSKIPSIDLAPRLKDRGYQTWVLVCPKCLDKWEQFAGDKLPSNCLQCNVAGVDYITHSKKVVCDQVDTLLPHQLVYALQNLKKVYREKGRHTIAEFLDSRISGLQYALEGQKTEAGQARTVAPMPLRLV